MVSVLEDSKIVKNVEAKNRVLVPKAQKEGEMGKQWSKAIKFHLYILSCGGLYNTHS